LTDDLFWTEQLSEGNRFTSSPWHRWKLLIYGEQLKSVLVAMFLLIVGIVFSLLTLVAVWKGNRGGTVVFLLISLLTLPPGGKILFFFSLLSSSWSINEKDPKGGIGEIRGIGIDLIEFFFPFDHGFRFVLLMNNHYLVYEGWIIWHIVMGYSGYRLELER
jgi:hypothetical protein